MEEAVEASRELASLTGAGTALNGSIRAGVTADGRLDELHLKPEIVRLGQRGPVTDSVTLAAEIKNAVNAAIDDLQHKIGAVTPEAIGGFEADLDRLAADLDRTLDRITTDIARAQYRLE
ncbi:MAG: YbaB/EbfC family nucleoid-associated protein [Pseudonocardiaceae bacterium]